MAPRDPIVLKLPDDAQMVPEGCSRRSRRARASPAAWTSSSAARRSPRCADSLDGWKSTRPVGRTPLREYGPPVFLQVSAGPAQIP